MMKSRIFIGKMLMLMLLIGMTACNNMENPVEIPKENDFHDFSKAIGVTWQLYGFGTVGEDEIQKAKPEKGDKEWRKGEQYTISFNEDGTLEGHTFSNDLHGTYRIDGNALLIVDLWATEVGELYDGYRFHEALYSPLTHIFEIRSDQLLIYYNEGQNFLLFDNVTR